MSAWREVFILQLSGQKRWQLFAPKLSLPSVGQGVGKGGAKIPVEVSCPSTGIIRRSSGVGVQDLGEPTHDVLLKPGSLLYVPRGYIHATSTDVTDKGEVR